MLSSAFEIIIETWISNYILNITFQVEIRNVRNGAFLRDSQIMEYCFFSNGIQDREDVPLAIKLVSYCWR